MRESTKWKMWRAILDFKTCLNCRRNNSKIYAINEIAYPQPPHHQNCRCVIERLKVLHAGTATNDGINGADWYLKIYGKLYMLIDKESKYDMLVVTDKRIFYNKTSENSQTKEILPSPIKNIFTRKNNNLFTKSLIIETESEIITFSCFEDVDNVNQILNSIIKANKSSI